MSLDEGFQKDFIKRYGKGVLRPGDFVLEDERKVVPVSPACDIALGGGIPEGSWCLLSGPAKCGKTTLALNICRNAQKLYPDKHIFYLDVENRIKAMNLSGIVGLDTSSGKFSIISSTEERIISGEEYLDIAVEIIKSHKGCIVIMDSISQLCPLKDLTSSEITTAKRPSIQRALAEFTKKVSNLVTPKKAIFIGILHLITNTSGYGKKYIEDSGVKVQYQGDVKLVAKKVEDWDVDDRNIGKITTWDIPYTALGRGHGEATSCIQFGIGVDDVREIMNLGLDMGFISKAGSWFQLDFALEEEDNEEIQAMLEENEKCFKVQGQDSLYNLLSSKRFLADMCMEKIKEADNEIYGT